MRIGLSHEIPVAFGSKILEPAMRLGHGRHIVVATSLDQQDANGGILASRRATTEPDEPEPQTMKSYCDLRFPPESPLIRAHTLFERPL